MCMYGVFWWNTLVQNVYGFLSVESDSDIYDSCAEYMEIVFICKAYRLLGPSQLSVMPPDSDRREWFAHER